MYEPLAPARTLVPPEELKVRVNGPSATEVPAYAMTALAEGSALASSVVTRVSTALIPVVRVVKFWLTSLAEITVPASNVFGVVIDAPNARHGTMIAIVISTRRNPRRPKTFTNRPSM